MDPTVTRSADAIPAPRPANEVRRSGEPFYLVMGIVALFIVLAGFFPTYISPVVNGTFVAKPFVHLHGSLFFLWILFSIIQPLLVRTGHTALHRKTGVALGFFAIAIVVMGVSMAIISAKVDINGGDALRPRSFLLIPLTDMVLFTLFAGLGILRNRRPQDHKRLMLLATVAILPAPFARLLGALGLENMILAVLIMNSVLFAGILNDFLQGRRLHRVYLFGGAALLITHFSRIFLSQTDTWRAIADWILGY